jgi:hypothetical protein
LLPTATTATRRYHRREVNASWNRSSVIGLAKVACTLCHGTGTTIGRGFREIPCTCAYRAAFRACLWRFRETRAGLGVVSSISLEQHRGRKGRRMFGRKNEEFAADFCLVAKRSLDKLDYAIFEMHFVGECDWRYCAQRLQIDRSTFFYRCYQIQAHLGRVFGELQPYPLYPLEDYFGGTVTAPVGNASTTLNPAIGAIFRGIGHAAALAA